MKKFRGQLPERWQVVTLSGGYAIVTLPQQDLDVLAGIPQVEYIEKPKRLYFGVDAGRAASCINPVQTGVWTGAEENVESVSDGAHVGGELVGRVPAGMC